MTLRTDLDFINAGYPTKQEMLDMANKDLLSFWAYYDEDDYTFAPSHTVTAVEALEDGSEQMLFAAQELTVEGTIIREFTLQIPTQYFVDWERWKLHALKTIELQLSPQ